MLSMKCKIQQCCALTGLKVETSVDVRNGFDVMTSKGRRVVMQLIKEQALDVIFMAPVCGPCSITRKSNKTAGGWGKAQTLHL